MIDLPNGHDVVSIMKNEGGRKFLIASDAGRGFIVPEDDVVAQTKNGKQVLNVGSDAEATAIAIVPDKADHIAVIGTNRKLVVFPMKVKEDGELRDQVPEMGRGKGVILQRYKDGQLSGRSGVRIGRRRDLANRRWHTFGEGFKGLDRQTRGCWHD